MEDCLNYEVIIHHYTHGDKKEKVLEFLNRKNGFPIVIVDGIVPDFLRNAEFIILLKPGERGVEMVREKYKKLRRYIIEECEYVRKNLQVLRQSKKYRQMKGNNEKKELFEIMMAVAEIWRLYEREKFQEEIAMTEFSQFCSFVDFVVLGMDRMSENYEVTEAVKEVLFHYVENNPVKFGLFSANFEGEEEKRILFDGEYYYFFENDLRKMCHPLLRTVSFLQLKQEMYEEGMIVCHNTKSTNYTVNKVYYDSKTGKSVRSRFIKIPKEYLVSEEGLFIEDYKCENRQKEITIGKLLEE